MSIYAISDLHLSFGVDKPMNIFGKIWDGYEDKIKKDGLTVSEAWLEYCKTGKMSEKKALKLYRKAMLWYFVCHVKWLFIDSLLLHN